MVDVAKIPGLMRAQSPVWGNAARLQDIWFGAAASTLPTGPVAAAGHAIDTATIKFDSWFLTFPRARKLYDFKVVAAEIWKTPGAQAQLVKELNRLHVLKGGPKRFGGLARPVEQQDPEYFTSIAVDSSLSGDPLDDLFGALGSYNLRLVAEGAVEPLGGTDWKVTVERVGIYVQDKFDFNDGLLPQPLGFWNEAKKAVSKTPGFGYDLVTNGDYRDWRAAHGMGGDFLVFSDIKVIPEAKPFSFNATGEAGTPQAAPAPPSSLPLDPGAPFGPPAFIGPPPPPASPGSLQLVVRQGDTLSGLAQKHYGDWQMWPLIWDQNYGAIGPRPSVLEVNTPLTLAPLSGFSAAQKDGARRRAPKWKNNELP